MSILAEPMSYFARPGLLALVLLPLLASLAEPYIKQRDRRRWQRIGNAATLSRFVVGRRPGMLRRLLLTFAWIFATVAVAGPRWGASEESGVAVGRDIVIVLDFSRSMWAEDMASTTAPARWQTAVAGAKNLVQASRRRGGDRIGIIIFAAQPSVVAPLTTDYDHLLLKLESLDARHPPAEIRPATDDATSGTRIGAALNSAVELHDARFPGFQEIVLLTDGDDPARDGEWKAGVTAARNAAIPVHVVGLGDPDRESFILKNGEPLEGPAGVQVQSRLHEEVARAIAGEGRGAYLPARTGLPNFDDFYRTAILANPTREVSDEKMLRPRDRSAWFFALSLLILVMAWCSPVRRLN